MYARRYGRPEPVFEADALARMRSHKWPGNVRELEHWVESAIVLAPDGVVRASQLPKERGMPGAVAEDVTADGVAIPLGLPLDEVWRYVEATVAACDGNKAEAARRLRVGRNTIGRTLKS